MYKLITWVQPLLHEAWFPILAQGDTVIERSAKAIIQGGADFGNSTDAVRFGIILFALLAVVGALAYLYVAGDRATIKELKTENKGLRDEIKENLKSYERSYDELRNYQETLTRGYWGTLSKMVQEFSTLNRVLENRELIVRRSVEPEQLPPPPPIPQTLPSKANFLPAGPRRIPRRIDEDQNA